MVTRRAVLTLAGMAVGFVGLAVAATLRFVIPQSGLIDFDYETVVDQQAVEEYYEWAFSGYVYYDQVPWLITVAVISGVAALTLAAYRAQRRLEGQAGSASATASAACGATMIVSARLSARWIVA